MLRSICAHKLRPPPEPQTGLLAKSGTFLKSTVKDCLGDECIRSAAAAARSEVLTYSACNFSYSPSKGHWWLVTWHCCLNLLHIAAFMADTLRLGSIRLQSTMPHFSFFWWHTGSFEKRPKHRSIKASLMVTGQTDGWTRDQLFTLPESQCTCYIRHLYHLIVWSFSK